MANAKTGKKVIRRRREKKNVEKGQVHIRSSFNNTMVTVTDSTGQRPVLGFLRRPGLPRQQEVHPLRRPERRRDRRQGRHGAWPEDR